MSQPASLRLALMEALWRSGLGAGDLGPCAGQLPGFPKRFRPIPGFRLPGRRGPAPNGGGSRFSNGFELPVAAFRHPAPDWICSTGIPLTLGLPAAAPLSPSRCFSALANSFRSQRRTTAPGRQLSNNGGYRCVRGPCPRSHRNRAAYPQIRSSACRRTGLPHPPATSPGFP